LGGADFRRVEQGVEVAADLGVPGQVHGVLQDGDQRPGARRRAAPGVALGVVDQGGQFHRGRVVEVGALAQAAGQVGHQQAAGVFVVNIGQLQQQAN
jgi:hypothetical protein